MPAAPLTGVRTLVVDDDLQTLKLHQAIFDNAGAVTRVATSAEQALDIVRDFKTDVVVTDFRLPGMSGLQLASTLKNGESTRGVMTIVITSEVEALHGNAVCAECCAAVIRKPVNALTLADQVARYFRSAIE